MVSADEVLAHFAKNKDERDEWGSMVEVVWAASEAEAIAEGAL